ncbi:MAG: PAS domain S-box protein, partial [Candidatus Delongbacteria bacterium]|nr:PAS domain S-box protein [Candidatus Delongbacteria bacterium]
MTISRSAKNISNENYKELYTMLIEAIPSSVLFIDKNLRIVKVNRNFLEKGRKRASDTIGKLLKDVFPAVIYTDMDLKQKILRVLKTGNQIEGERMSYRAPGVPLRIYYYSLKRISWNNVEDFVMLLMNDVTEQIRLSEEIRRIERHFASVVESASDIIISTSPKGNIISWNRTAEKLTGYGLEEVKDKSFLSFISSHNQDEVKIVFEKIEQQDFKVQNEWNLKTKYDNEIPVSWVCSPMKNDKEMIEGIVITGRNLTERQKFERQLFNSQKLASLGVMAGGIAHEIRNPLAIVSSASQFLLDDDGSSDFIKECADKIYNNTQKACSIIENLLRFARTSIFFNNMEITDLNIIMKEALILVANEAKLQRIEIIYKYPMFPVMISGNSIMLQQMAMNIILNAFNAIPENGILEIIIEQSDNVAVIQFKDNGLGIHQDDLDKIFDPFFTTNPPGKGTGLGLSICYSIVKQHFGTIQVESIK